MSKWTFASDCCFAPDPNQLQLTYDIDLFEHTADLTLTSLGIALTIAFDRLHGTRPLK